MRRVPSSLFVLSLVLPLAAQAAGVPLNLTTSGYLLDTGDHPVTEQGVALGFSIWTDVSSPADLSHVWPATSESACVVGVVNGFYSTVLDGNQSTGCGAGLSSDHLPGTSPRYLQVSVGGVTLSPRMRIGTMPSAALATQSADTQALIAALAQGGASVNDADNVVDWKALKGVPGGISDGVDADTTYAAATNGGLSLLGQAFSITENGVTNAMLAQSSVTVTAGTGLTGGGAVALGGTTTVALADVPSVTPGSYTHPAITVDAQGRVTAAASGTVTSGTVTSVGAGAGLSGGPITAGGSLAIANDGVTNAMLASDAASLARVSGGSMAVSGGNVGIGTATPQTSLHMTSTGNAAIRLDSNSGLLSEIQHYNGATAGSAIKLYPASDTRGIGLYTAGDFANYNAKVMIATNGNVGIGTAAPAAKLDVAGDLRASIAIRGASLNVVYGNLFASGTLAPGASDSTYTNANSGAGNGKVAITVCSMQSTNYTGGHVYKVYVSAYGNGYNDYGTPLLSRLSDVGLSIAGGVTDSGCVFTNASADPAKFVVKELPLTDFAATMQGL